MCTASTFFIGRINITPHQPANQVLYTMRMKKGGKRRIEGSAGFVKSLRQLRQERGLTQLVLARLVGVSPAHLSAIETGKVTNPGIELVQRIAAVLETTVLIGSEGSLGEVPSTLAYESPFFIETEAGLAKEISTMILEIVDLLRDDGVSPRDRAKLAERLLSYGRWQKDQLR